MQQARTREKINMHTKLLFIRIFIFPQPSHRNHARTHTQKAQHAPRTFWSLGLGPPLFPTWEVLKWHVRGEIERDLKQKPT